MWNESTASVQTSCWPNNRCSRICNTKIKHKSGKIKKKTVKNDVFQFTRRRRLVTKQAPLRPKCRIVCFFNVFLLLLLLLSSTACDEWKIAQLYSIIIISISIAVVMASGCSECNWFLFSAVSWRIYSLSWPWLFVAVVIVIGFVVQCPDDSAPFATPKEKRNLTAVNGTTAAAVTAACQGSFHTLATQHFYSINIHTLSVRMYIRVVWRVVRRATTKPRQTAD